MLAKDMRDLLEIEKIKRKEESENEIFELIKLYDGVLQYGRDSYIYNMVEFHKEKLLSLGYRIIVETDYNNFIKIPNYTKKPKSFFFGLFQFTGKLIKTYQIVYSDKYTVSAFEK